MSPGQVFEQSIQINASATVVEQCITDRMLMHRWLNPALRCEPVGDWSSDIGSRSRFVIQIPVLKPTLKSVVVERAPGLIVWQFEGFFQGSDRWECQPVAQGTHLINRFEFEIPNPIIDWGFNTFAIRWTKEDMQAQLRRLKRVAEEFYQGVRG
ncbi:SRPBCC family protein [Chroococcidiopsis sp. CCMEE 29]|uniref:SRPBCC family protein n=1 Tax=Chroococcidiopsis sp. CCMEE 29 TaxID=155894 RepID=UPI002020716D|nr:SRPBCC family protein [Chroococcidiopsis sp. CCMEE 29]